LSQDEAISYAADMSDLAELEQMAHVEYERFATWAALQMFPEKQERPLRGRALLLLLGLYPLSFAVWFLVTFLT
jgi:hypothetical protein